MDYTREDLLEAKRQIDSTVHKLKATVETLKGKDHPERLKSQITLAERRIRAFELASALIDEKLNN